LRVRADGAPALAFTPDFWAPDLGMYFELTTMRQKLVTPKNRKARLLSELRPDVRVRLLYRHDCQRIIRPVRTRKAREALLRSLLPAPPTEALNRAGWAACLPRTVDASGHIYILGVRLPLGPEWAGRRFTVWVYPNVLELESEGTVCARFPCSYDARARTLLSVEPGEALVSPDVQQAQLALPELVAAPSPGRRRRGTRGRQAPTPQLSLPL
jgi:hypothetical protein